MVIDPTKLLRGEEGDGRSRHKAMADGLHFPSSRPASGFPTRKPRKGRLGEQVEKAVGMAKKRHGKSSEQQGEPLYTTGQIDYDTSAEDEAIGIITTTLYWGLVLITIILNAYLSIRYGQQYFKEMAFRIKIWMQRVGIKRTISMVMQVRQA